MFYSCSDDYIEGTECGYWSVVEQDWETAERRTLKGSSFNGSSAGDEKYHDDELSLPHPWCTPK